MKLQATEKQLRGIRNMMLDRLDRYYGGGGLMIDTSNYERIRMLSNQELEKEFKEVYKIKTPNHYF